MTDGEQGKSYMIKSIKESSVKIRRKFDETFKREAVQNWLNSGKSAEVVGEELGITATQWTFVETLRVSLPGTSEEMIVHLFLITAWKGTPVNRQPEEHSLIHWFNLEEVSQLELADPVYPALFARYLESH